MNVSQEPSKGTVEQLRETLNKLLPDLEPDVEPAVVFVLEDEAERD